MKYLYKINQTKLDFIYKNKDIYKFINIIMKKGKKQTAENILINTFFELKKKKKNPIEIFKKAFDNITPLIEIRSKQIGGSKQNIPTEIKQSRQKMLACKFLLKEINTTIKKKFEIRLSNELILAAKNEGNTVKKIQNLHKMAEANRVFLNAFK